MKQFEEKFGKRVLVNCHDLAFNLQSCVAENEEGPTTNVRPAATTIQHPASSDGWLRERQNVAFECWRIDDTCCLSH